MTRKIGNERKLQETWQSYPLRPTHFILAGATFFKRTVLNVLLKIASIFGNNKVLKRIRFVKVEEIEDLIGTSNMPREYDEAEVKQYVIDRLNNFPGVAQLEAGLK